ncbi:MAG: hypothetical protein BWK79_20135 [Beggiatoa sp. IS2]|nr:MAG: hypothetical protein BWK79_20135 [Beggiatoa sp. IS2]
MTIKYKKVVNVTRGQTGIKEPMWIFKTLNDIKIYAFTKHIPLMTAALYNEIVDMELSKELNWYDHPITMKIDFSGKYPNLLAMKCKDDGKPDVIIKFDRNITRESVGIQLRRLFNTRNVIVLDTETTGISSRDEVLAIAAINLNTGASEFHNENLYFTPSKLSKVGSSHNIHGITEAFLSDKPTFQETYSEIFSALDGKIWMGYNIDFDYEMLNLMFGRYNLQPAVPLALIDIMDLYGLSQIDYTNEVKTSLTYVKLVEAVAQLGIPLLKAHNAFNDCLMTREIALKLSE